MDCLIAFPKYHFLASFYVAKKPNYKDTQI